ncbi:hypothetical protein BBJ28_00014451 [Nothophytophthora sp. Chile5]|nr:hypothetical protein BBJ28_00014451 [Nothophytophthora sp. Chile5]
MNSNTETSTGNHVDAHFNSVGGKLRPLGVTKLVPRPPSSAAANLYGRLPSTACTLSQITSLSVAEILCNEDETCCVLNVFTSSPATSTALALSSRDAADLDEPTYRIQKKLSDVESLRLALLRAVQVTHLLSYCEFCKAVKVCCVAEGKAAKAAAGNQESEEKALQSVERFVREIARMNVRLQAAKGERSCYGALQCWGLLRQFLGPQEQPE